jgi:transcriptional regulator with XRE-family HTH domain
MNNGIIGNIIALINDSPFTVMRSIAGRVKERRLEKNLTQRDLASRSGLSFGTYRRFEMSGEISLRGLVMIALTLDMTDDFETLFSTRGYSSMSELLSRNDKAKQRKRGSGVRR